MKKALILSVALVLLLLPVMQPLQAKTWKSPYSPFTDDLMAGNCILVDIPSETDDTHVYTLNPDNAISLNDSYHNRWNRNARCDEIQFHVNHNTPLTRLNLWLDETAYGWYENLGGTHFNHQTVSTANHEWYYVDNGILRRIPDWLTGLSWGLLLTDRISIPPLHTQRFEDSAELGSPLQFPEGSFATEIHAVWKDGERDLTNLPDRLAEEIKDWTLPERNSYMNAFESCEFDLGRRGISPHDNLLDWSWMLRNPGCPLAN